MSSDDFDFVELKQIQEHFPRHLGHGKTTEHHVLEDLHQNDPLTLFARIDPCFLGI